MRRFLRPGFLVQVGECLWAVDAFQPVAAVLDPSSGTVRQLVSWAELPPPPATGPDRWRVFGSPAGLWVQPFQEGPVALINTGGLVRAYYTAGQRLSGVTAAGAWCGPRRSRHELVRRHPKPENVLCLDPDGATRTVTVDRPVGALRTTPDGLYVRTRADPANHSSDPPPLGKPDPGESWLHLPAEAPAPEWLTRAEHGDATPPPPPRPGGHRDGPQAGGLRWAAGWPQDTGEPHQAGFPVIATGQDPADGREHRRVELGRGEVLTLATATDDLWLALRRAPPGTERGGPVELARLNAREGSVTTPLPAESVDITEHCWPLPPKPVEAEAYADYQRRSFDGLTDYAEKLRRAFEDGDATALAGDNRVFNTDLRGFRAELTGHWPDTTLELHCTHARYPGLELVRVLALFDELGRQIPPDYAGVHLMEAFDTGQFPPASAAVHGQLYI